MKEVQNDSRLAVKVLKMLVRRSVCGVAGAIDWPTVAWKIISDSVCCGTKYTMIYQRDWQYTQTPQYRVLSFITKLKFRISYPGCVPGLYLLQYIVDHVVFL